MTGLGDRAKVEIWEFGTIFAENTHVVFLENTLVSSVARRHNRALGRFFGCWGI